MRWLDIATCAAAERHAGWPCVTASVLDLVFDLETCVTGVIACKLCIYGRLQSCCSSVARILVLTVLLRG